MAAGDVDVKITTLNGRAGAVFDGVDDFVDVTHNANQLGASLANGFTIGAWINTRGYGEGGVGEVVGKNTSGGADNGFHWAMRAANTNIEFSINGAVGKILSATGSITHRTWAHFLIIIKPDSTGTWYKNGVLSGTENQAPNGVIADITTTNDIRIGNRGASTDKSFDGTISDVQMWNRVLTQAEITAVAADKPITNGRIVNIPLKTDYTGGTNSGSYLSIVDDAVATQISGQRVLGQVSGAYMITGLKGGQIASIAVTE